jgi:hypothetical protein
VICWDAMCDACTSKHKSLSKSLLLAHQFIQ